MARNYIKEAKEYGLWRFDGLAPSALRWFGLGFMLFLGLGFLALAQAFSLLKLPTLEAIEPLGRIFLALGLSGLWLELFLRFRGLIKRPDLNPFDFFDRASYRIAAGATRQDCGGLSESLLNSPAFKFYAAKLNLNPDLLKGQFNDSGGQACFEAALKSALENAAKRGAESVLVGDLILGLYKNSPFWRRIFDAQFITEEDLNNIISWRESLRQEENLARRFWEPASFLKIRPAGLGWSAGYTVQLDEFAVDIAFGAGHESERHAIIHKEAVARLEKGLALSANGNALLVGDPGVGKKTIIEVFAKRVYQGQSLPSLNYKRVLELNMEAVLSGASDPGAIRARLIGIFNEAIGAGNVILVIHNLHNFIGRRSIIGGSDLSEALVPYLQSPAFKALATTTEKDFQREIEPNAQLAGLLAKVEVKEPSANETVLVLQDLASQLERAAGAKISYQALKEIVRLTDQYFLAEKRPFKAVKALNDLVNQSAGSLAGEVIAPAHVQQFLSQSLGFSVGVAREDERAALLNLETELHKSVVGQDAAVKLVAEALRRSRSGIQDRRRPIGSFLFLGPTGVGKTSVAKALAKIYFGNEQAMTRFDMSEYQSAASIVQFIGSPSVERGGRLTESVKARPFSLILLDEVEKAHPSILDVFLQILDEGTVRDGLGDQISFTNTIIIATSNAGSEFIREHIKDFEPTVLQVKLLDEIQRARIFRPEFLNRFDAVVPFKPLTPEQLVDIARLMLAELSERVKSETNITLAFDPKIAEYISEKGFQPEFGARPMRRVIQDTLEAYLAKALLGGKIKSGDSLKLNLSDLNS